MLKKINLIRIIGTGLIVTGVISAGLLTVACGSSKKSNDAPSAPPEIYNEWSSELESSTDDFDKTTLDWYKQNTGSILVYNIITGSGSAGTIWNYPTPAGQTGYFFATNIHVVNTALTSSASLASGYGINTTMGFQVKISGWSLPSKISGVSAYYVGTKTSMPPIASSQWANKWYSDIAILRTNTKIFNDDNTQNFMDTVEEYNWLKGEMEKIGNGSASTSPIFYSCGYPSIGDEQYWPDSTRWVNVKYQWNAADKQDPYVPAIQNEADMNSNYLAKDVADNGIKYVPSNARIESNIVKKYAQQLLLPRLDTRGGSSGSLVSVKYKNSLMFVGIYWGVYQYDETESGAYRSLGGVDLFFADKYQFGGYGELPSYNNLK